MSIPEQALTIAPFSGTNQGLGRLSLPDAYSPEGSYNVWIDKRGRIRAIQGWTVLNTQFLSVFGQPMAVRRIIPFRYSTASTIRHLFAITHDAGNVVELWESSDSGATWARQLTVNSAGAAAHMPDAQQIGDTLYLVLPYATTTWVKRYTNSGGVVNAVITQLAAPTVTASATAGELIGTYRYILVPVQADGTRKAGSIVSTPIQINHTLVDLAWVADADVTVTGYELYRTSGTGQLFYFVTFIPGRTTVAYTDKAGDPVIVNERVLEEHGDDILTDVLFLEAHKSRLFIGGRYDDPYTVYYSDPGRPESFNYLENRISFADAATFGDIPRGFTGGFRDMLVVWYEKSIWTVSGTGTLIGSVVDWNRRKTDARVGTVSHETAIPVPIGAKYQDATGAIKETSAPTLAYLTPLNDIRLFDGQGDEILSGPVSDTLQLMSYASRMRAYGYHDTERSLITWVIPTQATEEPERAVVWNYRFGTWHEFPFWALGHVVELESPTEAKMLIGGTSNHSAGALFYELWHGPTLGGTVYYSSVMTKPLYPPDAEGTPDLSREKRFRSVELLFERSNVPETGALEVHTHDAESVDVPAMTVGPISAAGPQRVDTQDSDGRYFHGLGVRFRFYLLHGGGGVEPNWILNSLRTWYQLLPGTKKDWPLG